jgi:hypothetical protein
MLIVLAGGGFVFRTPLLISLAGALVVDQRPDRIDCVLVGGGDGRFDLAAQWYVNDPALRILQIEPYPECLVREGFEPAAAERLYLEMQKREVPADAVTIIPGETRTAWESAHQLDQWLLANKNCHVVVICDRFGSRVERLILNRTLRPDHAQRVFVRGLPDRRHDETNWWQVRSGAKQLVRDWLRLAYVGLIGEQTPTLVPFDPDAFEQQLQAEVAAQ